MRLTLTVCDVCADKDAPTTNYELKQGDRKVKVDLCAAHAQPLEAFLDRKVEASTSRQRTTKKAATRGRRQNVTSMEEIEAMKASQG